MADLMRESEELSTLLPDIPVKHNLSKGFPRNPKQRAIESLRWKFLYRQAYRFGNCVEAAPAIRAERLNESSRVNYNCVRVSSHRTAS
jgi:hypothetical protein